MKTQTIICKSQLLFNHVLYVCSRYSPSFHLILFKLEFAGLTFVQIKLAKMLLLSVVLFCVNCRNHKNTKH